MNGSASSNEPQSNIEWRRLGQMDVGVSDDYASGTAEWQILRDHLKQYGVPALQTACEIGCGAGRMTNAVAADFDKVHGLDVSEDRIRQSQKITNACRCQFHKIGEPRIPLASASCDLIYSIHVFQHISGDRDIQSYFEEAFRVLRPRGVLLIHLPMIGAHGRTGEFLEVWARGIKETLKRAALAASRLLIKIAPSMYRIPLARYRVFSFARVAELLSKIGFEQIEMRLLPVRDYHSYVFARKPGI